MQVLKNSSIAVGLEWTLHDSISEARKAAAGKKKILVVRKVISGECVQGICNKPFKAQKLQAGALLVAAIAKDALIYHSLGNGMVWVCAIREGIPLHGFDVVVDEKLAKETLAEVMSYVPLAEIYGDTAGAKGSIENLFAQITPWHKKAAVLASNGSPVFILALLVGLLLMGALVMFGYQYYVKKMASGNTSSIMQSEEEKRRIKQVFEADVAKARLIFWHARSPSRQFAIWYDVLRTLPVSVNGWTPSAFNCDISTCKVTWRRDSRALPSTVANLPGTAPPQSFNPDIKERITTFTLDQLELVTHTQGTPQSDQYLLDVGASSALFKLVLNPSQTGVNVAPPSGAQDFVAVTLGQEGGWKATGTNLLLGPVFLNKIALPGVVLNALSIKNLTLSKPPYMIELEGRYRVGS
ncbi:hypothetical protein BH11PSE12_BH11PSE12_32490 [soil metagenome]